MYTRSSLNVKRFDGNGYADWPGSWGFARIGSAWILLIGFFPDTLEILGQMIYDLLWSLPESGVPEYEEFMELIKLGKKGQISIPRSILKRMGISDGMCMLVDTTPDGAIVLRQAAVYPLEIYSEERIAEFLEEDKLSSVQKEKIRSIAKGQR